MLVVVIKINTSHHRNYRLLSRSLEIIKLYRHPKAINDSSPWQWYIIFFSLEPLCNNFTFFYFIKISVYFTIHITTISNLSLYFKELTGQLSNIHYNCMFFMQNSKNKWIRATYTTFLIHSITEKY